MDGSNTFIRVILSWICAGHIVEGLLVISGRQGIRLGARLYGADFEPSDQFRYIIRAAGAYLLADAFLQSLAVREPRRYKGVIDATIAIFALRFFQRVVYRQEIYDAYAIAPRQHWLNTAFMNLPGALLLLARLGMDDTDE